MGTVLFGLKRKEVENMPIIVITISIMYIILISWCFHNLGNIEPFKKILCIGILILILYIATSITFNISRSEVTYPNTEMIGVVKQTLVWIFAGLNGFFVMPYICREIEALYQENITTEQCIKRIGISAIVVIILLILECGYMTSTQKGILEIVNRNS